jgi:hypothetical protein
MKKTLEQINQEIEALKQEAENLKNAPVVERNKEMEALADMMHQMTCHMDHTDVCDYYYFDWDNPRGRTEQMKKLNDLIAIVGKINMEQLIGICKATKRIV